MKLRTPKSESRARTRATEVLDKGLEVVPKPFNLEEEFALLEPGLKEYVDRATQSPAALVKIAGKAKVFFPDWKDAPTDLDYSRSSQYMDGRNYQTPDGIMDIFFQIQLFPQQREALLRHSQSNRQEVIHKGSSPELFLIDELLVSAAADPENIDYYYARAKSQLENIKAWIIQSLNNFVDEKKTFQLAANFLWLCPEYKTDMQQLFTPLMPRVLEYLRRGTSVERFDTVCDLEAIFGKDEFVINQQGTLVRHPATAAFMGPKPLPDRLVA